MKIAQINSVVVGSTGKIMFGIASLCKEYGMEVETYTPLSRTNIKANKNGSQLFGNRYTRNISLFCERTTGLYGCFHFFATRSLIHKLNKFQPDLIQLHNLHGSYINLPMLFRYIKKKKIPVVWTLHDCWAFTGHCPYFTIAKCEKWKTGCHNCPTYRDYPQSFLDNSRIMWKKKKNWFTGVPNMTIVTPSHWLADLVKESYLQEYPVKVIHNGIDLDIFKPTSSDFRSKYHLEDKYILLGVAFNWGFRKGLDVFIELSKRLPTKYQIVLVGTNDRIDKQLPENIISIHKTQNQAELAEIYSAADLFVNPTREEVLGLVNIEANVCGTPVLTFKTGGSPECISGKSGSVVACDDIDAMEREIISISQNNPYNSEDCIKQAENFTMNERYRDYLNLYRLICRNGDE